MARALLDGQVRRQRPGGHAQVLAGGPVGIAGLLQPVGQGVAVGRDVGEEVLGRHPLRRRPGRPRRAGGRPATPGTPAVARSAFTRSRSWARASGVVAGSGPPASAERPSAGGTGPTSTASIAATSGPSGPSPRTSRACRPATGKGTVTQPEPPRAETSVRRSTLPEGRVTKTEGRTSGARSSKHSRCFAGARSSSRGRRAGGPPCGRRGAAPARRGAIGGQGHPGVGGCLVGEVPPARNASTVVSSGQLRMSTSRGLGSQPPASETAWAMRAPVAAPAVLARSALAGQGPGGLGQRGIGHRRRAPHALEALADVEPWPAPRPRRASPAAGGGGPGLWAARATRSSVVTSLRPVELDAAHRRGGHHRVPALAQHRLLRPASVERQVGLADVDVEHSLDQRGGTALGGDDGALHLPSRAHPSAAAPPGSRPSWPSTPGSSVDRRLGEPEATDRSRG